VLERFRQIFAASKAQGTVTRRDLVRDALLVAAIKTAVSLLVLALGFTHVSDDDYARVVIAQLFAHSPKLDPSGTSWLPFPFWVNGLAMMIFGRTLEVARVVAITLSSLAATAPYLGARAMGVKRTPALLGAIMASCTPVCAWLGAATVPEGFSGLVTAGAIMAIASGQSRPSLLGAAGLLVASLSRYESWPACALAAVLLASRTRRAVTPINVAGMLACALGPIAWMLWNKHQHGSFTHFFTRVSAYHAAHSPPRSSAVVVLGEAAASFAAFPESLPLMVLALVALRHPTARTRWALVCGCVIATIAFLVIGDLRGGAPTHHAERALVPIVACVAMMGNEQLFGAMPRAAAMAGVAWLAVALVRIRSFPGGTPAEDRRAQIARGRELRGVATLDLTPCAYEHFALIAAFGSPENVTIGPPVPAGLCPSIRHP
jgi:hypothetical protein